MVTIKDISKISGYSVTTVSKALNNYSDISDKTKAKILELCDELGYVPNASARSLISKKSYTIGVIFEEITGVGLQHPLFSKILEAFKSSVEKFGYDILFLSKSSCFNNGSYYQHSLRKQVEAIFILCAEFDSNVMAELYQCPIPKVIIDFERSGVCNITSNNKKGINEAIDYFVKMGHTKIANIHGGLNTYIGQMRMDYFVEAMKAHNLEVIPEYNVSGELFGKQDGINAMNELLKLEDRPTAVFCAADMLAIGAIQAIESAGMSVPKDFSIIGFDGINVGQMISPKLTTVRQKTEEIGATAARNILAMIQDKEQKNAGKTITVDTEIIVGETVRRLL